MSAAFLVGGNIGQDTELPDWAPTSRGLVWVANGCRTRKLPVASALLIRRELAHEPPAECKGAML